MSNQLLCDVAHGLTCFQIYSHEASLPEFSETRVCIGERGPGRPTGVQLTAWVTHDSPSEVRLRGLRGRIDGEHGSNASQHSGVIGFQKYVPAHDRQQGSVGRRVEASQWIRTLRPAGRAG